MFARNSLAALAAIACASAAAQEPQPRLPLQQPGAFEANAVVEIGPQGNVLQVEPDAALPDVVRTLLASRIAEWHFEAPRFEGRPVRARQMFHVRLQPAQTTAGGYGLRVLSAAPSPVLPTFTMPSMRFDGRPPSGTIALGYVVSIDAEGKIVDLESAWHVARRRGLRTLDSTVRQVLRQAPVFVRTADGAPIACRAVFPIHFSFDGTAAEDRLADVRRVEGTLPDLCPNAALLTKVAGTAL